MQIYFAPSVPLSVAASRDNLKEKSEDNEEKQPHGKGNCRTIKSLMRSLTKWRYVFLESGYLIGRFAEETPPEGHKQDLYIKTN